MYFCREILVSPDALMSKAFGIRRFSRATLQKTFLRTEVQLKATGHLNTNRVIGRTMSHDNLPTPEAMDGITAKSSNLTYKTVRQQGFMVLMHSGMFPEVFVSL